MATKTELTARLMAQEKVRVEHRATSTAYFDLAQRVVVLPIFKESVPQEVYDLLVGHEIGHALETPAEGWHGALAPEVLEKMPRRGRGFKSFLNVVEDARIERAMKSRYPGLRKQFYSGYTHLYNIGFFGEYATQAKVADLLLIDRINLHYKLGAHLQIPFNAKEKAFLQRIDLLPAGRGEGWAETVKIATEIYDYCRKELDKKLDIDWGDLKFTPNGDAGDLEPGEFDENDYGDFDDDDLDADDDQEYSNSNEKARRGRVGSTAEDMYSELESLTDSAFRSNESTLADLEGVVGQYVEIAEYDPDDFIVDYKDVLNIFKVVLPYKEEAEAFAKRNLYKEFMDRNGKYIAYLAKEFELRKNAAQFARAKTAKTGALDVNKLFSYKFNSELFKTVTVVPNGKNHGLLMIIDWSGSMQNNLAGTIEQVMVLAHFCRKVSIPFDVYTFLSYQMGEAKSGLSAHQIAMKYRDKSKLQFTPSYMQMGHILSSKMKRVEFTEASNKLYLLSAALREMGAGRYHVNMQGMGLSGTPLNECVLVTRFLIDKFKKENKLDVCNTIILTDGEGSAVSFKREYGDGRDYYSAMYIDPITKKEVRAPIATAGTQLRALVQLAREATGTNIVGFYVANNYSVLNRFVSKGDTDKLNEMKKTMRHDKFVVVEDTGFSEYYVVKGGKDFDIEDEELKVKENATKNQVLKAFQQNQNRKSLNRVLLNRFAKAIS